MSRRQPALAVGVGDRRPLAASWRRRPDFPQHPLDEQPNQTDSDRGSRCGREPAPAACHQHPSTSPGDQRRWGGDCAADPALHSESDKSCSQPLKGSKAALEPFQRDDGRVSGERDHLRDATALSVPSLEALGPCRDCKTRKTRCQQRRWHQRLTAVSNPATFSATEASDEGLGDLPPADLPPDRSSIGNMSAREAMGWVPGRQISEGEQRGGQVERDVTPKLPTIQLG